MFENLLLSVFYGGKYVVMQPNVLSVRNYNFVTSEISTISRVESHLKDKRV